MVKSIRLVVPDAAVHVASTVGRWPQASDVYRLCQPPFNCSVVCCPWAADGAPDEWVAAIGWAVQRGVLVFGAAGNGTPRVPFPAAHEGVVSCAAGFPDGRLDPLGSPLTGRIDMVLTVGSGRGSTATARAAGVAVQWLGAGGVYLFGGPAARLEGFRQWLRLSGVPLPGGRGVVPFARSL